MNAGLKLGCWLGLIMVATSRLLGLLGATTNWPVLNIHLRDGTHLIGKDNELFKFQSPIWKNFVLSPGQMFSIQFETKSNHVKVATINQDTLSAEFQTREIHLVTSFGKIEIPAASVQRIDFVKNNPVGKTSGLVAFWPAEGNEKDIIGNHSTQTIGPLDFVEGRNGQAFFFNGNSAYLMIHGTETLDVGKGDGFTFEGWINPTTIGKDMIIFEFERHLASTSGTDVGMELAIHRAIQSGEEMGCLYANIKDVGDASHIFTSPPNLLRTGTWQHVALTYQKETGEGIIYLNGQVAAHADLGNFTPQTSFPILLLGAKTAYNSIDAPGNLYRGGLDEFGIYERALSPAEIQAIYSKSSDAL